MDDPSHQLKIKILLILKNVSIQHEVFYLFGLLLKVIGLVIHSHSLDQIQWKQQAQTVSFNLTQTNSTLKNVSISDVFRSLTLYSRTSFTEKTLNNSYSYDLMCFAIYFILLLPVIAVSLIYHFNKKKQMPNISDWQIKILKFSFIIMHCIIFFSQHIIELLTLVYIQTYGINLKHGTIDSGIYSTLQTFENRLMVNKNILLLFNSISLIIVNLLTYYIIRFLNEPFTLTSQFPIRIFDNRLLIIFAIFTWNFQGIETLELLFSHDINAKLVLAIISIVACSILLNLSYSTYIPHKNRLSNFFLLIICCSLVSSILEIYIYCLYPDGLSLVQLISKIIAEIVIGFTIKYLINFLKHWKYLRQFTKNVFTKKKEINDVDHLHYFSEYIFCRAILNFSDMKLFFGIIENHRKTCQEANCPSSKIDTEISPSDILRQESVNNNSMMNLQRNFFLLFGEILIWMENEIVNMVYNIGKAGKIASYYSMLILHLEYISHFKKNQFLCCYYLEEYLSKFKHIPLSIRLYFQIFKKYTVDQYRATLESTKKNHSLNRKISENILTFSSFLDYHNVISEIKLCLLENCKDFESLIALRKLNKGIMPSQKHLNIEEITNICWKLNQSSARMSKILKENFSAKNKLENEEVSYLLYNYFMIMGNSIPEDIQRLIKRNFSSYDKLSHFSMSYYEKNFMHPMIISIESQGNPIIKYVCKFLTDYLNYNTSELLDKNIHELIPNAFVSQHKLAMINFLFKSNIQYIKKNIFMVDKFGYYVPIKISIAYFPTMENNITVVANVGRFFNRSVEEINTHYFVLDEFANILTYSQEIEDKLGITNEILEKLKLNFITLLNLNEHIFKVFSTKVREIKDKTVVKIKNFGKVFKRISLHDVLTEYNINKITAQPSSTSQDSKPIIFETTYDFRKFRISLDKMKNCIKESQMDSNLLKKVVQIEKEMDVPDIISPEGEPLMTRKFLSFRFSISSIGNIPFYIVSMIDHIDLKAKKAVYFSLNAGKYHSRRLNSFLLEKSDHSNSNEANGIMPSPGNALMNNSSATTVNKDNTTRRIDKTMENFLIHQEKLRQGQKQLSYLLTKDKKVELNLHEQFSGINYAFMTAFFLCLSGLLLFNYSFKATLIDASQDIFLLNFNVLVMKSAIYYASSVVIDACSLIAKIEPAQVSGFILNLEDYRSKSKLRANELMNAYLTMKKLQNKMNLNETISDFLTIDSYKVLLSDWSYYYRNSTLDEEILYFHYYMDSLKTSKRYLNCNLEVFFKHANSTAKKAKVDFEDMVLFYVIENVLTKIIPKLEHFFIGTTRILDKANTDSFYQILLYNSITLGISILFLITIITSLVMYRGHIIMLLDHLLTMELYNPCFEQQISAFIELISNFNYEKCIELENIPTGGTKNFSIENEISQRDIPLLTKDLSPNKISNFTSSNLSCATMKPSNTSITSLINENFINNIQLQKDPPRQQSTSMAMFMSNYSHNQQISLSNITLPLLTYFKVSIVIGIILYTIFVSLNIIVYYSEFQHIMFSNHLSFNFIDRIPRYAQLIFYYKLSVIFENPFFLTTKREDYLTTLPSNYYNVSFTNPEDIFSILGDSEFAHIYYLSEINRMNIQIFTSQASQPVLGRVLEYEKKFNQWDMPFHVWYIYYTEFRPSADLPTFIADCNKVIKESKRTGNNMNKNGLYAVIDYLVLSIKALYKEFYFKIMTGKEIDLKYFLSNNEFMNGLINIEYTLKKLHSAVFTLAKSDITNLYSGTYSNEVIFSSLFIVYNLAVIAIFQIFLFKLSSKAKILQATLNRLNNKSSKVCNQYRKT